MSAWRVLLLQCIFLRALMGAPSVPNPNVALLKTASQSSTYGTSAASVAVDGNTGSPYSATVASTDPSDWHWWAVDLGAIFTLKSVVLVNAGNANGLANFSVEVSAKDPTNLPGFPGATNAAVCMSRPDPVPDYVPVAYACDLPVTGRYVRIVKSNWNYVALILSEFEAYTYLERNATTYLPLADNLALNKPAIQSSTLSHTATSSIAALVVDGNLDTDFHHGSCSHTAGPTRQTVDWWMVDLEHLHVIRAIRIIARTDCCQNRLQNFTIEISVEQPSGLTGFPSTTEGSEVCHKQIEIAAYHAPATYACDRPIIGRYVRVFQTGDTLTLCEAEVLGRSLAAKSWSFVLVTGTQKGIQMDVPKTLSAPQNLMMGCLRQRVKNNKNLVLKKFVRVDLNSGACSFHQTLALAGSLEDAGFDNAKRVVLKIME